jgi:hypothetical protein
MGDNDEIGLEIFMAALDLMARTRPNFFGCAGPGELEPLFFFKRRAMGEGLFGGNDCFSHYLSIGVGNHRDCGGVKKR